MPEVYLKSVITCPVCDHAKEEMMAIDSCAYFYECENCKALLKALPGHCCVFCSYGSTKCPPVQLSGSCCN
ncbi:MAG TPA: GDCCVxC domain-containing (seleno)protein [Mucilaginibacter sp.]